MQDFRGESIFADYLAQQPISPSQTFSSESSFPITSEVRQEHFTLIQSIQSALQRVQPYLSTTENEGRWTEQLSAYMERLKTSSPAQTPEEQFSQLYQLRKLLFWVPVTLLAARKGDLNTLLVLGHFYAAALSLEAIFRDIGAPFLASLTVQPLEEIISVIQACQETQTYNSLAQTAAMLMDFPRDALARYRTRQEWARQQINIHPPPTPYGLESLNIELGNHIAEQHSYAPSLSPAFASSTIHLASPAIPNSATTPRSPFLEVPHSSVSTVSSVDPWGFGGFPASTSYHSTPTSAYAPSPLASSPLIPSGLKDDGSGAAFQLTLPGFAETLNSTAGVGSGSGSHHHDPWLNPNASSGASYGGFTTMLSPVGGFSGGCVAPTAVWS
jgi:hypothetical protein